MIVKPAQEGSSVGMSKVDNATQLKAAWQVASEYDSQVLAESWITGGEYTVAILAGKTLPAIRLETNRNFYDYTAKYEQDDNRYFCPCGLSNEKEAQLADLAKQAFFALGCSHYGRVDVMLDEAQNPWLLEANTIPGMTDHSLVPMAAKVAGLSFDELVLAIVD